MRCKYPMMFNGILCPCKRCMPCRINTRRTLTTRMILESMCHESSTFFTLTYAPEFLPEGGNLSPRDISLFMKRLRKSMEPRRIRYFYCGEYGDKRGRPHYHGIVFGLDPVEADTKIKEAWKCPKELKPIGNVDIGLCERDSVQYVAGYVLKKLTDKERNSTKVKEFHRQSLKPGLGSFAIARIAEEWTKNPSFWEDAPTAIRVSGKLFPLGRFLRRKVRLLVGSPDGNTPAKVLQKIRDEVSLMRQSITDVKAQKPYWKGTDEEFACEIGGINSAIAVSMEAKAEIYNGRKRNEAF